MAEEVVVKDQLTESMIASGRALTEQLVGAKLDVICALWLYDTGLNQWRLVFSSPRVDTDGPLRVYETIQELLKSGALKETGLKLQNISAVPPSDPVIRAIRSILKVKTQFANIRFARNRINDIFIEDAYIYFVA